MEERRVLLERSEQLALLDDLREAAAAGRGSVALVEGPAGIGKTSLLAATRDRAKRVGVSVLSARAALLERDLAWNVVRQLFAAVIGAREIERAELLSGACALATPALGLPAADLPAGAEAGALHGLYWLTSVVGENQTLLVAVDDAHWADLPSLQYLAYLGERVSDLPVLIVVSVRTGEERPRHIDVLGAHQDTQRIALCELSASASAQLTRESLGLEAAEEFSAACHEVTGGNPFLLSELLDQMRRDRIAPSAERAPEVRGVTPESVKRVVLLRLSSLPPAGRELAAAVAVLGADVSLREAAAIAGLDGEVVGAMADQLSAVGIFAAGTPLQFIHPLVGEVIYAELAAHERDRRHRETARALATLGADPQRVAVQLLPAVPNNDPWVVERLREAARLARSEAARAPAIQFLERALSEPPEAELRIQVLRELAGAESLGRGGAAIARLEEALALATEPREWAQVAVEQVLLLFRHGRMRDAVELARQLLERLGPEDRGRQYRPIAVAAVGALLAPELRSQMDWFLERVPAELPGESPEERFALDARLAQACARLAPMDELGQLAEIALGAGRLLYWNAVSCLIIAERFVPARAAIEAAVIDSRRRGSRFGFGLSSLFSMLLHYRIGDVAAATADGRQAVSAITPDDLHAYAHSVALLADCLIERGELPEALSLTSATPLAGELPNVLAFHLLRVARGRVQIALGDTAAGVEELLATGELMGPRSFGPMMIPWRARAAAGLATLGRHEEARILAQEELDLARQMRSPWAQAVALQALAAADRDHSVELLAEAVAIAEPAGLKLEHARGLILLGAAHRRSRRQRVAAELLHEGLDAAKVCGARALEKRARDELQVIGLKPRGPHETGRDTLTPAEHRVAEMAATGMTNREIAQALFVSLRTVETHLTHSYQKLDIDSRAGLGPALAEA